MTGYIYVYTDRYVYVNAEGLASELLYNNSNNNNNNEKCTEIKQTNERTNDSKKNIRIIKSPNTQMTMMTDADIWMCLYLVRTKCLKLKYVLWLLLFFFCLNGRNEK